MITVYLVCFLVGLGLSVVSFVSGLDRVNVFDHIFGHVHHAGGVHHHHTFGKRTMSPFNAASVTAFLAWFGGGGMVLHQLTVWSEAAIVAGSLGSGVLGGSLVNRFLGLILTRERPLQPTTLIGVIGHVTSRIREGGTGEVVFVINGTRKVSAARADSGAEIHKGTEVIIVRMEKGIAYVSTWDELAVTTTVA
jgi:membrane protein implicated in regulation of membrane protease activity